MPATGIQDRVPRPDAAAQELVEEVDVDLPELRREVDEIRDAVDYCPRAVL
ncbi:MAG: hypothetical protein ABIQ65_05975 [Thermoanaerobaculia bacterium]